MRAAYRLSVMVTLIVGLAAFGYVVVNYSPLSDAATLIVFIVGVLVFCIGFVELDLMMK